MEPGNYVFFPINAEFFLLIIYFFKSVSDAMDLSRFGSSVTITPILAVRNTATTTNLSPPAPFTEEAEVIVVEVEPDFIAEEDSSEEDEEDDEEEGEDETRDEEAISMTQTVRYRYARIYPILSNFKMFGHCQCCGWIRIELQDIAFFAADPGPT